MKLLDQLYQAQENKIRTAIQLFKDHQAMCARHDAEAEAGVEAMKCSIINNVVKSTSAFSINLVKSMTVEDIRK